METNNLNEEKHLEAMKQKSIDSNQVLEFLKFNLIFKNHKLESDLLAILEDENLNLESDARRAIAKCVQTARGYTEYKVTEIAANTGFNRTRVKTLIQYLIEENQIELVNFENTTFLKIIKEWWGG